MATTWKILAAGQLAGSSGVLYTVPSSTMTAVTMITLVNTDSSSHSINVALRPSGAGASVNIISKGYTLAISGAAGDFVHVTNDAQAIRLKAGDTIEGFADSASKVDYCICGSEQS